MRICRKCLTNRSIADFSVVKKVSDTKIYHRHTCKLCQKQYFDIYNKKYYEIKKEKIISQSTERYLAIKDSESYKISRKNYQIEYAKNNQDKIIKNRKKQSKNRYKSHNYRLHSNISRAVRAHLFFTGNFKNKKSILSYLDYSINELKLYIENKFEYWMNWSNYGNYSKNWNDDDVSTWTWNIDHIIPQSLLPYDSMANENFKKCWELKNLRPYSSKKNLQDGNRRGKLNVI
jgi:hypothetical protein